jgi:hypothetical protein
VRRVIFVLSMFAALSGTPLRQAEAWNDLARSLAELDCPDEANLEEVDGGVGDDAGDAIRAIDDHAPVLLAISEALPVPLNLTPSLPSSFRFIRTERMPPPRAGLPQRLALLQRFLL